MFTMLSAQDRQMANINNMKNIFERILKVSCVYFHIFTPTTSQLTNMS